MTLRTATSAGLVTMALVIAACSGSSDVEEAASPAAEAADAAAEPVQGGDLVFARPIDVDSLDKDGTFLASAIWTNDLIYETLTDMGSDGKLVPGLATEWESSDDGREWTFTLRDGVQFSNGEPLTAEDVVFTLEELQDPNNPYSYYYELVEEIEAPDPSTVVIRTSVPWPMFAETTTYTVTGIIPNDYAGMDRDEFYADPIGSGPFQVAERVVGESVTLERNEYYWQEGKPYLDTVTFTVVGDDNTRTLQLAGGEAHIIQATPGPVAAGIEAAAGAQLVTFDALQMNVMMMNAASDGPLGNVDVRRAVQHAIDREAIVTSVLNGHGTPADSFLPPAQPFYASMSESTAYNPERAEELLAGAGYGDGFEAELILDGADDQASAVAAALQQQFQAVGLNMTITTLDEAAAWERYAGDDFDFYLTSYSTDLPDPGPFTSWLVDGGYEWTLDQAAFDELTGITEQARTSVDEAEQADLYREVQQKVADMAPQAALWSSPWTFGIRDSVKGFEVPPSGVYHLENVWLDEG